MKRFLLLITMVSVLSVTRWCGAQWMVLYYSAADSVIYLQAPDPDPSHLNMMITLRIQNGGSRIERALEDSPGRILTSDGIPGHVYGGRAADNPWESQVFGSVDYGETWTLVPTAPAPSIATGLAGTCAGHSSLEIEHGAYFQHWIYCTSDSWLTYDSVLCNEDSIGYGGLTFTNGTIWGHRGSTETLSMSYDTGQTWTATQIPARGGRMGAVGEFWGIDAGIRCTLMRDSGLAPIDTVYQVAVRMHPYPWELYLLPTNNPGEAYIIHSVDDWGSPDSLWMWIFHIQERGARVDSFYFVLDDFCPTHATQGDPMLPRRFEITAYPNPFNSSLSLEWGNGYGASEVTICDLLGRRVWNWTGRGGKVRWDGVDNRENALPSGRYFVTVRTNKSEKQTRPVFLLR